MEKKYFKFLSTKLSILVCPTPHYLYNNNNNNNIRKKLIKNVINFLLC